MSMFCYQCQETAKGTGCTLRGVCGKTSEVANLQNLLLYVVKGISVFGVKLREAKLENKKMDQFMIEGLFSTITNVNFDQDYFVQCIREGLALRDELKAQLQEAGIKLDAELPDAALWRGESLAEMEQKAAGVGVLSTENEDIRSLRELIMYGLKGMAAYAYHARVLGFENEEIDAFMQKAL
ncbi:MAG: hydroxylamine reductase, partial [Peptococcia bacterium]